MDVQIGDIVKSDEPRDQGKTFVVRQVDASRATGPIAVVEDIYGTGPYARRCSLLRIVESVHPVKIPQTLIEELRTNIVRMEAIARELEATL